MEILRNILSLFSVTLSKSQIGFKIIQDSLALCLNVFGRGSAYVAPPFMSAISPL